MKNTNYGKTNPVPGKEPLTADNTFTPNSTSASGAQLPVAVPSPHHRFTRLQTPLALKQLDHWVNWKLISDPDGRKPRKVPINPRTGQHASGTRPETWSDFETARTACQRNGCAGLGFELRKESGLVAIDIDHCYSPVTGTFNAVAKAILAKQPTYAEFSPSGDGIHLWFRGVKPGTASRNSRTGVEMYDSARYMTVTGRKLPNVPQEIAEAEPDTLEWIYRSYIDCPMATDFLTPPAESAAHPADFDVCDSCTDAQPADAALPEDNGPAAGVSLTDEELLSRACRNERFAKLYAGDWETEHEAGMSHSEADLSFCSMLAFWTGKDPEQMDRIFRRSGLMREKWNVVHYASGETYGEHQIALAIRSCKNVYSASFCDDEAVDEAFRKAAEQDLSAQQAGTAQEDPASAPGLRLHAYEDTESAEKDGPQNRNDPAPAETTGMTADPEPAEKTDSAETVEPAANPELTAAPEPVEYPEPAPEPETPPIASFGNRVYISGGRYIYITDKKHVELTNFVIHPVARVEGEGKTLYDADYITTDGHCSRISMTAEEFSNCGKFHSKLNATGIERQFYGDGKSMEALKNFLSRMPWPKKRGVSAEGIYFTQHGPTYVSADGAFAAGGVPVDDIRLMNTEEKGLSGGIAHAAPLQAGQLKALGPSLLGYNELPKTVTILGWSAGCFLKQHLKQGFGIKFPHLNLRGEAGSGKSSTLESVIQPVFSTDRVYACSNVSHFSMMKLSSSSNLSPFVLDEFKPWRMGTAQTSEIQNFLRDAYDGHDGVRGCADQTTLSYTMQSPVVIAGEAGPEETALRERCMEVSFSKQHLREPAEGEVPGGLPGRKDSFLYLRSHETEMNSLGYALLSTALTVSVEEALSWYEEGMRCFNPELPPRIRNNLSCIFAGLRLMEAVCVSQGFRWEDIFPVCMEDCKKYLESAVIEYLLDGSTHNKSIVEKTLEVMSRAPLVPYIHFWLDAANGKLMLHLSDSYDVYLKYAREHGLQNEILSESEFRKQLKSSGYLQEKDISTSRQLSCSGARTGTRSVRVCILDLKKLSENCDVSGFEEKWRMVA